MNNLDEEILSAIDNIDYVVMESELDVLSTISSLCVKSMMIKNNTSEQTFQECFVLESNMIGKIDNVFKSAWNAFLNLLKRIGQFLKRQCKKIKEKIKNIGKKRADDELKESNQVSINIEVPKIIIDIPINVPKLKDVLEKSLNVINDVLDIDDPVGLFKNSEVCGSIVNAFNGLKDEMKSLDNETYKFDISKQDEKDLVNKVTELFNKNGNELIKLYDYLQGKNIDGVQLSKNLTQDETVMMVNNMTNLDRVTSEWGHVISEHSKTYTEALSKQK